MALEPTLEAAPVGVAQDDLLPAVRGLLDHEFDVVGRLGVGGMATVYLAYERALARFVALKVMHPALVASSQMRERFLREARLAAALDHRNVVPIHGLRETGGLIILVLRAVMGRSLAAILADHGPLPIPVVQRVVAQVAGALHHAHKRGIIHRDVKPGNILIDEDGTVVVSDFGIAKALEAPEITSTGHAVGTPAYMSPEQCDGRAVTPASDQYGLGAVAYEMLSGHPPFRADSAMGIMYAQAHTDPTPLPEVRAGVPLAMALAVQRMLTKDPAGRWPDLDDVVRNVGRPPLVDGLDDPSAEELARLARSGSPGIALSASYVPTPPRLRRTDPDAATLLVWGTGPRRWGRPAAIAGLGLAAIAGLLAWPSPVPAPVEPLPARTESLPPAPRPAPAPAPQADAPATPPIRRVLDPRRDT
ncbi:MAG TPA: serine/threonine-protein kinase, partial [Gemmatimonadales bacterium]|nr:serine/threonine-protein kinase [Gemmatimonadales bacterium]